MTQRLRTRRPDKEIYVPRHKRDGNEDAPFHVNVAHDVKKEVVSEEKPTVSNLNSKYKSNKKKMNHGNTNEERLNTKKSKDNKNNEIKCNAIKMQDVQVNINTEEELITHSSQYTTDENRISCNQPEEHITVDNTLTDTDDALYTAACYVSEFMSELIFASVYQCVGKVKRNHETIYNCSERYSFLILQDSYESSVEGIKKSRQKLIHASTFSEKMSHATLQEVYKDVNDEKRKCLAVKHSPQILNAEYPPPQALNNELHMQLMLPEIVTNIINTAIENALEITKASMKSEIKSCKPLDIFQNNTTCIAENQTESSLYSLDKDTRTLKDDTSTCIYNKIGETSPTLTNKLENLAISDSNIVPSVIPNVLETDDASFKETFDDIKSCNSVLSENKSSENCNRESLVRHREEGLTNKENEIEIRESSTVVKKKKKTKEKEESSRLPRPMKKKKKKKEVLSLSTTKDLGKAKSEKNDDINLTTSKEDRFTDNLPQTVHDGELDDWDMNYNEDGECLNEEIYEPSVLDPEDCSNVGNGERIDYLDFKPKDIVLDIGEFGHVLELYDFTTTLKSSDLNCALKAAGIDDYTLHWVDDSHALAVFASQLEAHTAMKVYTPVLQMRQVVNGTRASRIKIKDLKDVLLPYKKRPQTTSMVARNLVAGSLGIRTNATKEQRDKEKEVLRKAREEKRLKEKKKRDIWESPDGC